MIDKLKKIGALKGVSPFNGKGFSFLNLKYDIEQHLTPLDEAIEEIEKRRQDPELQHAVHTYLRGDIPKHFKQEQPVFYLSRHIPTPNEETLFFVKSIRTKYPDFPVIIGMDTQDTFSNNNVLKKNLGKMPINRGTDKNGKEVVEKVSIVDFNNATGKSLDDILTHHGVPLVDFHINLLEQNTEHDYLLADESAWVSRNARGELLEHYKHMLSLLVVHGIMFEFYEPEDEEFVTKILTPAMKFVEKKIGHKPLITRLIPKEREAERDWNAYPATVYPFVQGYVKNAHHGNLLETRINNS